MVIIIDTIYILNRDLLVVDTIDEFKSLIWTERYSEYGDFELVYPYNKENKDKVKIGQFISIDDSNEYMLIETIEPITHIDDGSYITVSGRSLTSILFWRIIWYQTILDGNIQTEILSLLNRSLIQPSIPERKLDNPGITFRRNGSLRSINITRQFTGDILYDAIKSICDTYDLGFHIFVDDSQLIFEIYEGTDRSYNQLENPQIVFSSESGNLISSDYLKSEQSYRNVALVAGEDEGSDRRTTISGKGSASSWERRELYVDARDIQSTSGDEQIDDETYIAMLKQRGDEKLAEVSKIEAFDGENSQNGDYIYKRDFSLGDIVQVENEYGINATARITEYIRSIDEEGSREYPTFTVIEHGGV